MSLIHWWPLNGNLNDIGVDNFTFNSVPSFIGSGKIGQCATNSSLGAGVNFLTNQTLSLTNTSPISIFTWVYMNDYSTHGANLNGLVSNHNHAHNNDTGSGFGLTLRNNGDSFQVSVSTSSTSGRTYSQYCGNTTFSAGEWHHVGFTYNGSRINFYLDGNYDGGVDFTSSYDSNNPIGIFCWSTGYSGYSSNCQLNDVRIYDHALSQKEVKEISKGLVLHYNFEDAYAEGTTNIANQVDVGGWNNSGTATWNNPDTTISDKPCVDSKVISLYKNDNGNSCITFGNADGTNLRGKTVTASTWVYLTGDQDDDAVYLRSGAHDGAICYLSYNGSTLPSQWPKEQWIHISGTGTVDSDESYVYFCTYLNIAGEKRAFNGWQLEQKDHATPYVNGTRQPGLIYDNSGYGYNGTVNGNLPIYKDYSCASGDHYIKHDTDYTHNIEVDMNPSFITSGLTLIMWVKNNRNFLLANGQATSCYLMAMDTSDKWCGTVSGSATYYMDGVVNGGSRATDGQWHMYAVTLTEGTPSWSKLYFNRHDSSWVIDGDVADIKLYATALSAEDILLEYNRKASIGKTGKLFTPYIKEHETTGNIGELANYYIETQHAFDGRFGSISEAYYNANYPNGEPGLGTYEQGNLVVTMTNQGIRIYSEANRDGRAQEGSEWNTWGGFCWSPMKQSRCLIKGHHYRISWHVKGQSSRAMTDAYWSNQIGWGQYPDAGPTVHKSVTHPADFQGEMDCFYDFTIEDDIFKTTGSDVHSGFEPNTSYLAYSAFKIGYTYDFTGPLGTDIYITNLQLHDLTTGEVYKVEKSGIVKTTELVSGRRDSARLHSDGVIDVTDIEEC